MTIKVLLAVRGNNLLSDSDYIYLIGERLYLIGEQLYLIGERLYLIGERLYLIGEQEYLIGFTKISNRVQCDSINSNKTSHASTCIQIKTQEQFNEAYSNSTLPNH